MTVVISRANWQDASAYTLLTDMHQSLLMWEWLRRDSGYSDFYIGRTRHLTRLPSGVQIIQLTDDIARRSWGLHFRRVANAIRE